MSIVQCEIKDEIAWITMDDGKANALSHEMIAGLAEALDEAAQARAVVLRGRAGRFSAGFDLKVMMAGPEQAAALLTEGARLFMRFYLFEKPVVMAVTGHAIAGGVLLAATGDYRVGVRGAFKVGLNEVSNGLPVPILAHELARVRLLPTEFERSVLFAHMYEPDDAARAGWLDKVVEGEELLQHCEDEAARLGQLSPFAFSMTKKSIRSASAEHIETTLARDLASLLGS